jgi:hypothetical protein
MSGGLPTPPDSGSRATAAGWAAEVYLGLATDSLNEEADLRSKNETPEWLTPRSAPGDPGLEDLAAATKRCLYPDNVVREGSSAGGLESNNHYRGMKSDNEAAGAMNGITRNALERRASRISRFREALNRIDEHRDTIPPLPSRHPARTSTDEYDSSPGSPPASSQSALMSTTKTHPTTSSPRNPFADDHVTSILATPPRAHFPSTFGNAASLPAHLQHDPTPPKGQGSRIAGIEYATPQSRKPETSTKIKRRTLGVIQEDLKIVGEVLNEELARTSREAVEAAQQAGKAAIAASNRRVIVDRPAALPKYIWWEITALGVVLAGVLMYAFVMLVRQRTGIAYANWRPGMNNATLKALGSDGRTTFRASTPDKVEMYVVSKHTVTLDERQRVDVCLYNTMPTFNLTTSHIISGMQNLTPRDAGFPALALPSFGHTVAFCMMVCGIYTLLREILRRGLRKFEVHRYEKGSVSTLGKALDSFLAWSEVVSILLPSVFTALLVSGIVTAVLRIKM